MQFAIIHPRDFHSRFGIKASPATLSRWKKLGFPASLEVPRGFYVVAEVEAWLARRAIEARTA